MEDGPIPWRPAGQLIPVGNGEWHDVPDEHHDFVNCPCEPELRVGVKAETGDLKSVWIHHAREDTMTTATRPYAAQTWAAGYFRGPSVLSMLQLVAKDLMDAARGGGIVATSVELWTHTSTGSKGLFVGDTSGLAGEGWQWTATF
jgi:hypothetical protein